MYCGLLVLLPKRIVFAAGSGAWGRVWRDRLGLRKWRRSPKCGIDGATWIPNGFWLGSLGEKTPISLVVEVLESVAVGVGVKCGGVGASGCGSEGAEFRFCDGG